MKYVTVMPKVGRKLRLTLVLNKLCSRKSTVIWLPFTNSHKAPPCLLNSRKCGIKFCM